MAFSPYANKSSYSTAEKLVRIASAPFRSDLAIDPRVSADKGGLTSASVREVGGVYGPSKTQTSLARPGTTDVTKGGVPYYLGPASPNDDPRYRSSAVVSGQKNTTVDYPTTTTSYSMPTSGTSSALGSYVNAQSPTFYQSYKGTEYRDLPSFRNAVLSDAQSIYDDTLKNIDRAYQNGLLSFQERDRLLSENRDNIRRQAQEAMQISQQNVQDLGFNRDRSLESQRGYFSQIAPNAEQSQQGTYMNRVLDEYNRGISEQQRIDASNQRNVDQTLAGLDFDASQLGADRQSFEQDVTSNRRSALDQFLSTQDYLNNLNEEALQNQRDFNGGIDSYRNALSTLGNFNTGSAASPRTASLAQADLGGVMNNIRGLVLSAGGVNQRSVAQANSYLLNKGVTDPEARKEVINTALDQYLRQ